VPLGAFHAEAALDLPNGRHALERRVHAAGAHPDVVEQGERQSMVEGPLGRLLVDEELAGHAEVGTHELGTEGRQRQVPKRVARQLATLELLAVPVGVAEGQRGSHAASALVRVHQAVPRAGRRVEALHQTTHGEDGIGGVQAAVGSTVAAAVALVGAGERLDRAVEVDAVEIVAIERLGDALGQTLPPAALVTDDVVTLLRLAVIATRKAALRPLDQRLIAHLGPLRRQRRELVAEVQEQLDAPLVAGRDQFLQIFLMRRFPVVLDRRPILVEDQCLDAEFGSTIEHAAGAALLERPRLHPIGRAMTDPPVVEVARHRFDRRGLETEGELDRQAGWRRVEQVHPQHCLAFLVNHLDSMADIPGLPSLIRLGEPREAAVLPAEPHEGMEGQ